MSTTDTRERDVEAYLVKRVVDAGGEVRKLKWIGRAGAPDRAVFLHGVTLVELKRPGKHPTGAQQREMARLSARGAVCEWVNSFEMVDELMSRIVNRG